jgi:hypothetical protein
MEGFMRTDTDVTLITDGQVSAAPLKRNCADITNHLVAKKIVFSAVCDWNIRMIDDKITYRNQCYATQTVFNLEKNTDDNSF